MAQLWIWTKIRTKLWLVLGASAFQCMHASFLCTKCDNFAGLHTRQDQNELHLKIWYFFLPKSSSSVSRSVSIFPSVVQAFGESIKLIICQIYFICWNQMLIIYCSSIFSFLIFENGQIMRLDQNPSWNKHLLKKQNVRWPTLYFM